MARAAEAATDGFGQTMVGRNYSEEDIAEILNILYGIAEEGYEAYQEENGGAQDFSE